LGVQPALGRLFTAEECRIGSQDVVLLGYRFWREQFGGDRAILGRQIIMEGMPTIVVSVLPPGFELPGFQRSDLCVPLRLNAEQANNRRSKSLRMYGKLRPHVSLTQAQTEMTVLAKQLEQAHPETNRGRTISVAPLLDQLVKNSRTTLLVLLGAVSCLLLIACVNVANLLLARAVTRQREICLRLSLGATHARLFGQLMTESIAVSLLGGFFGLLLAYAGTRAFVSLIPDSLPNPTLGLDHVAIDYRVLAFAFGMSLLSAFTFGSIPAANAIRSDVSSLLGQGPRASGTRAYQRLLHGLAGLEVALGLILLAGAGLMIRSFTALQHVPPGFDLTDRLLLRVPLPRFKMAAMRQPQQRA
jgi:putative ABC transport system permease protein